MKIASIEVENEEQMKALKAFAEALKMKFIGFTEHSENQEKERILTSIEKGYTEMLELTKEKREVKSYSSFKEIFDDL